MKEFLKKYRHGWILSYFFIYLGWFFWLEEKVTSRYHIMHTDLDDQIPFCEYFIIPYLLWFLYIAAAILFFFFTNKEEFYRLCIFLFTGMSLCLLICTLIPNGTDLRPAVDADKNICSFLVSLIYRADTCTNVFPSIHAYNSIVVHIAVQKSEALKRNRVICCGSFLLAVSICLSTVFLKQHSVLDVLGAMLLAVAVYPLAYGGRTQQVEKRIFIR